MRGVVILLLGLAVVSAVPKQGQRIVGGDATTVHQYPQIVSLLYQFTTNSGFWHKCGGTILNNRSYLTAAHCTIGDSPAMFRSRVGSTNSNSGGIVIFSQQIINHPNFNFATADSDIAIVRTLSEIPFSNVVQPASIAGSNYHLADDQPVWAVGWGATSHDGPSVPILRHVQIYSINQEACRQRYALMNDVITDNMLCSGILHGGGRDQCQGDSGGPLFHHGVLVGVCSWGRECASPIFPGVNVRVSKFTTWIAQNA